MRPGQADAEDQPAVQHRHRIDPFPRQRAGERGGQQRARQQPVARVFAGHAARPVRPSRRRSHAAASVTMLTGQTQQQKHAPADQQVEGERRSRAAEQRVLVGHMARGQRSAASTKGSVSGSTPSVRLDDRLPLTIHRPNHGPSRNSARMPSCASRRSISHLCARSQPFSSMASRPVAPPRRRVRRPLPSAAARRPKVGRRSRLPSRVETVRAAGCTAGGT